MPIDVWLRLGLSFITGRLPATAAPGAYGIRLAGLSTTLGRGTSATPPIPESAYCSWPGDSSFSARQGGLGQAGPASLTACGVSGLGRSPTAARRCLLPTTFSVRSYLHPQDLVTTAAESS